jgi:hypothetical protein
MMDTTLKHGLELKRQHKQLPQQDLPKMSKSAPELLLRLDMGTACARHPQECPQNDHHI